VLQLPSAALHALGQQAKESVSLVLVATNANGTGRATQRVAALKRA
jgi:hypothetical protein